MTSYSSITKAFKRDDAKKDVTIEDAEKAVETLKEIKKRYKLTAAELADVGKAIKQVGNQLGDIDDAIKGKARKGRKKNG